MSHMMKWTLVSSGDHGGHKTGPFLIV